MTVALTGVMHGRLGKQGNLLPRQQVTLTMRNAVVHEGRFKRFRKVGSVARVPRHADIMSLL